MQSACAMSSSVACPAVKYFSTLSHRQHEFKKRKAIEHKMCVLSFSKDFIVNFSLSKKN
jgi:hypothetical protein